MDVLGFAIMGNHFHLVVRTYPESDVSDKREKGDRRIMFDFKSSTFYVLCSMFQKCKT
ncbi:hypothetical protein JCM12298_22340 [Desulfothermus naphthae]